MHDKRPADVLSLWPQRQQNIIKEYFQTSRDRNDRLGEKNAEIAHIPDVTLEVIR